MSVELDEIWTLYADDGGQSLDAVEEALLGLKDQRGDAETIAALFRAIHTFKGNARVLGLAVIEARAHTTEDLIGVVRDEGSPLDDEMHALLLEAADALRGMLEDSVAYRRDVTADTSEDLDRRMQDKLERCRAGEPSPPVPHSEATSAAEDATPNEASAAAEPVGAVIFEPMPVATLANDPMYREIFAGMVHDVMREIRQALGAFSASPHASWQILETEAKRLCYAAEQIGMPEWPDVLREFLDTASPSAEIAESLLRHLESMAARDFQPVSVEEDTADDAVLTFFNDLAPLLSTVSLIGGRIAAGEAVDVDSLHQVVDDIQRLAEPLGLARVSALAGQLPDYHSPQEFRQLEFQFYEELASVELAEPERTKGAPVTPITVLRSWCADQVFESLFELGKHLGQVKKNDNLVAECKRVNELMRHLYHACHHYGIETAAHLCMSLVDLFSRVQSGEMPPDPVLLHIARSFVGSMELVFDAVGSGDAPDMGVIEKLFEAAADVTFTANGVISSSAVEARLGLPRSFHKVLTPESVKTALAAMDAGQHFYIVRTDLNLDEEVAGRFLEWINSGIATAISNVTVFDGDVTLFDFLLSTPMDETHLAEAMAVLDPQGRALRIEMTLSDRRKQSGMASGAQPDAATATGDDANGRTVPQQDTISSDMLETIGEIIAGQAMVHHQLADLLESDLARLVEAEVRNANGDWNKAHNAVRSVIEGFSARIEKLVQAEAQLGTQLSRLQEEAITIRTRPATLLLKPLEAFAESTSRQHGRQVTVSCSGEDLLLDITMVENLKAPLRSVVQTSITRGMETPDTRVAMGKEGRGHIRVALQNHEDHITATVEDDGNGTVTAADVEDIRADLCNQGGDLRVVALPAGGTRYHLTMPMAMVVMDGMVVRVGEVRYVVSLEAIQNIVHSEEIMRISADHGRHMLKLGAEDVVPIGFLAASGATDGDPLANRGEMNGKQLFVVVGKHERRVALSVDELLGQQVVLIRPLQGYLASIRGVIGCALLGGGEVGMVLDVTYALSLGD